QHESENPTKRDEGTKAKIATSCGNAFVTNILLARGVARGKRLPAVEIPIYGIYTNSSGSNNCT
uniref:hypothetical protein n=1 Tax=Bacillus piscicola TaxID=1632684 RepID=UPI001F090A87